MKRINFLRFALLLGFIQWSFSILAVITPSQAGYLDAVANYGADSTGQTVTTTQLQNAINGAIAQNKPLFIPAGTYLIDKQLDVKVINPGAHDIFVTIVGSSVNPAKRTTLLLKAGTFPNAASPGTMLKGWGWMETSSSGEDFPDTYDRVIQSIDFKIQENNAGAIALQWRGAEGCGAFDINIDVTGGLRGMLQASGSGGSAADIKIIGGEVGIDLSTSTFNGGGTQPTPVFTNVRLIGQTVAAVRTNWNRGSVVLTGAEFLLNPGVFAFEGLSRHQNFPWYPGGNIVVTDAKIEYSTYNANNLVIKFQTTNFDNSFNFNNVYVKNADRILDHSGTTVQSNHTGWRRFKELTYSATPNSFTPGLVDEGIFIGGTRAGNLNNNYVDDSNIPSNLISYHGWGETFPSFETPGAINVKDYEGMVDNGDWAPAFQAAIADAESNGSNVVFVPVGTYSTYNTITLGMHTKLIGVSNPFTQIWGYDMAGRRFGGSTDAFSDSKPLIKTQNSTSADNILADIAVRPVGSYNGLSHEPTPTCHYSLLWQAGRNSIIRNILTEQKNGSQYYRPSGVFNNLANSTWLSLKSIASPTTIDGISYSSDCNSKFFNYAEVPSRIWLETTDGSKRLMARSHSPFNSAVTTIKKPNIILEKSGSFSLNSLKVANSSYDAYGADDILIEGYLNGNLVYSTTVPMKGLNKPRTSLELVTLNWSNINKIIMTSNKMFSIDDVTIDGSTSSFETVTGTTVGEPNDYQDALYASTARDLPLNAISHHLAIITGGVKWYNHWKHGDTWLPQSKAYVAVINNNEPVNFYHFHAQHSHNDQKLYLENAQNVSVFGIKTENAGYFVRAINSNNIRIFGHGGLTNAPPPASHYLFENCTNYEVASITDELFSNDNCQYCSSGNALLPQVKYSNCLSVVDVTNGVKTMADAGLRPILWIKGTTEASYLQACTNFKSLNVVNGSGSGNICVGSQATVVALPQSCKVFNGWTGDVSYLADPSAATTTLIMPNQNITVTATYTNLPTKTVTVNGGTGSGNYCTGSIVTITAVPAVGQSFSHWTGNVSLLSNPNSPSQTFTMPGDQNLTFTANYITNIAYGKYAWTSSVRIEQPTRVAANVVDGDLASRWESQFYDPQWVAIDFGQTATINEVKIHWEGAYATAYNVQVSNDSVNWSNIYTTYSGDGGIDQITVSAQGKYLRVYGAARNTIYGYSIYEIEVFGSLGGGTTTPVTGVSLNQTNASINVGQTLDLNETVVPANATNKSVNWSTSSASVATVNSSGLVTAVAAGSATITVTTVDGGYTATCTVTVQTATVPVTGVTISQSTASINVGQTLDLNETVAPANATNKSVNWSTSSASVATVNSSGLVTAVAAGSATITVTTVDGGFSATCIVTVQSTPAGNLALLKTATASSQTSGTKSPAKAVDGSLSTYWESAKTATAWIKVDLGASYSISQVILKWNTTYAVNYQIQVSDDNVNFTDIYTTTSGDGGTDDITLSGNGRYIRMNGTLRSNTNSFYQLYEFEVYGGTPVTTPVSGVSLSQSTASLTVGQTLDLNETVVPANATNKSVTWTTSNATVATVNSSGLVTALAAGNATITVTTVDGGYTATCAVSVQAPVVAVTGVSVSQTSANITEGQTLDLNETVAPANATNKSVTWTTSNASVATVNSSGLVTALAAGNATITVTTVDGGYTATCAVSVQAPVVAVTGVSVSQTSANINEGQTLDLNETVVPANATNKSVTWTTSNTSVATVNSTGLVTAVAAGSATITVTTVDGGYTATCAVSVQATIPGATYTLTPIADSYVVYGSDAATNYGNNLYLRYRDAGVSSNFTYHNYLKFDLASVTGQVTSAKLRLYCTRADNSSTANIYLVNDDSWTESGITAINQPTNIGGAIASPWNPFGLNGQYIDIALDLAMVQSEADGDNLLSMKSFSTNNVIVMYYSKDNTSNKPQLVVETGGGSKSGESLTDNDLINSEDDAIMVYPNPAKNYIVVNISGKAAKISVTNLQGQNMLLLENRTGKTTIDINQWNTGLYLVSVNNGKTINHYKIMVK